jgi:plasmid stabilization system protein ParE
LKERRIRFTATARRHVERERTYWIEHRDYPDIFPTELEAALRILAVLPGAGSAYAQSPVAGVRRLYMQKLACHVYYTFDENEVIVRAVWSARREHGPMLR